MCLRKLIFEILLSLTTLRMLLQHMLLNRLELKTFQRQKSTLWKRRLEEKLKKLSRDLDCMNFLLEKRNIKKNIKIGWKEDTILEERDPTLSVTN